MRVLIDTDVVLDVLLEREPWFADSVGVWKACEERRVNGWLGASTFNDVFKMARPILGLEKAKQAVERCRALFSFEFCSPTELEHALNLLDNDPDHYVLIPESVQNKFDAIVTRNPTHFVHVAVRAQVMTPAELLAEIY